MKTNIATGLLIREKKVLMTQKVSGTIFDTYFELPKIIIHKKKCEQIIIKTLKKYIEEYFGIRIKKLKQLQAFEYYNENISKRIFVYIIEEWEGTINLKKYCAIKWVDINRVTTNITNKMDLSILNTYLN